MRLKPLLVATAAVALAVSAAALSACGGTSTPSSSGAGGTPAELGSNPATEPSSADEQIQAPTALPLHVSTQKVAGTEKAIITTDKGVIEIEFYAAKAPNTVASFIELANAGFFDGTKFHRVESQLIQGGDPLSKTDSLATGSGNPGWRLKAEFNDLPHEIGTVAMARTDDPDTAGSQFYICKTPLPMLNGQYTVFGHVVKGMDVVNAVTVGTVMKSVRIVGGPSS